MKISINDPKPKYRVTNWPEYNKSLKQRGSVTFWFSEDVREKWLTHEKTGKRGASQTYSDLAIETFLTVMALYKLPLRAAEGFIRSIFELTGLKLGVPEYSTVSRRRLGLKVVLPRKVSDREIHVVIDSTGVKIFGEGEWKVRQHGYSKRRTWRKLHLAVNEATLEIVACAVSENSLTDGEALSDLLEQIPEPIKQVSTDGAYDWFSCYESITQYQAKAVIPPRENAKIKQRKKVGIEPLPRDENLRKIRQIGRRNWKIESGYHRRSLAETNMFRFKQIFGGSVQSRTFESQAVDLFVRCALLNRMTWLGMPVSEKIEAVL
jgi:hypothetical protein